MFSYCFSLRQVCAAITKNHSGSCAACLLHLSSFLLLAFLSLSGTRVLRESKAHYAMPHSLPRISCFLLLFPCGLRYWKTLQKRRLFCGGVFFCFPALLFSSPRLEALWSVWLGVWEYSRSSFCCTRQKINLHLACAINC